MNINKIERAILSAQKRKIVVFGDFCLDKYIYSDPAEDDVSVESGMPAWQVYEKKIDAGVAGTITHNLCALGAQVICVGVLGDDGEGYEVLKRLNDYGVDTSYMITSSETATCTYLKTMRKTADGGYAENLRFDFRNRHPVSKELRDAVLSKFRLALKNADGVVISDQYYERNTGLISNGMRNEINEIAGQYSSIPFLTDSRGFSSEFENTYIKCNNFELMNCPGMSGDPESYDDIVKYGKKLSELAKRPAFITRNKDGIVAITDGCARVIPTYPPSGKIDVTGSGDASNAGIIIGLSAGLEPDESALIACAVSSVTIEQLGTTGTSTPEKAVERVHEISKIKV